MVTPPALAGGSLGAQRLSKANDKPGTMGAAKLAAAFSLAFCSLTAPGQAQVPALYKTVNRVTWVVTNIDIARPAWEAMGLTDIQEFVNVPLAVTYKGQVSTVRAWQVTGHIGNLTVDMIQPAEGQHNAYTRFLDRHGDGIFSIVHEVSTEAALKAEIARMKAKGVGVLQQARMPRQNAAFTYFDTEAEGKFSLGLVYRPGGMKAVDSGAAGRPATVQHFGFVVKDIPSVSAYWQKLGFPKIDMQFIPPRPGSIYKGKEMLLPHYEGGQQYSQFTNYWVASPTTPPNIYADYMGTRRREGIQHIALAVPDLQKAITAHDKLGYRVTQFTTWGDVVGKPGSGEHAYLDTEKVGGLSAELYRAY
jgi:catechol 2,3-dioxygenase-like lactoylglutathione lyase family enzyme